MSNLFQSEKCLNRDTNIITFGSCISFICHQEESNNNKLFLNFPGCLRNKLQILDFSNEKQIINGDFSFSLFKIFPFEDSNFKYQQLIQTDLIDNEEDFKKKR